MKLSVDVAARHAKMRSHTATHLLHSELGRIFPDTKQAGSLVDNDLLRFDFYAERLLNEQELDQIQSHINVMIHQGAEVRTEEMSIDEAGKLGAKMFFEDKYGDRVRVVQIEKQELSGGYDSTILAHFAGYGRYWSIELCGGTHVDNIREIGSFVIISQEAVASGIKRITALTGPRVLEKISAQNLLLDQLKETIQVKSIAQLPEKSLKIMKELSDLRSQVESLESKLIHSFLETVEKKVNADFDVIIQVPGDLNFKMVSMFAKQEFGDKKLCLYTEEGNFLIAVGESSDAKLLAQKLGLKGGGNSNQVQGRDEKICCAFGLDKLCC